MWINVTHYDLDYSIPSGNLNLKLTSQFSTTSIDLILTCHLCQIINIVWTLTHYVNLISRMCLENNHWKKTGEKKKGGLKNNAGWKKCCWCPCATRPKVDINLMLTVDITKLSLLTYGWWSVDSWWHHFDVNSTIVLHWICRCKNECTMCSLNTVPPHSNVLFCNKCLDLCELNGASLKNFHWLLLFCLSS